MRDNTPDAIETLIKRLAKLPGMGNRSAKRVALYLLSDKNANLVPLQNALQNAKDKVQKCTQCGNLDVSLICSICSNEKRDATKICIVQSVGDIWAMERTGFYNGHYHVLGGVLSALDGITPDKLSIEGLLSRLDNIIEVIMAFGATVDGQATAHYIAENIKKIAPDVIITRLAYGVPIGGEVEYLDDSTLATAMKSRGTFKS
jgi:recombination protein RecR